MNPETRASWANSVALWTLAVIATLYFLRSAKQLLIPIALAVLISYALEPVVAWLERHRVHRTAGATLMLIALIGLGAWGAYALRDDAVQAVEALPEAARRARALLTSESNDGPAADLRQAAQALQGQTSADTGNSGGAPPAAGTSGQQAEQAPQEPQEGPLGSTGGAALDVSSWIQFGVTSMVALAGHITVILFLIFFLLMSGHHFKRRMVEITGPGAEKKRLTASIIGDINEQIQRFLLVRAVTAAVVGVLTWAVLAWIGVQHAAVWGVLAGVFNSIPYFGPVIVSGGLLVVGLVQDGEVTRALQMSGAALAITSLEGWLLTPALMGKAERMNVLAVFLGLLLWTWVWGAWGTILAVPMLVVIKSVADRVEGLKPIGRLMGA